MFEGFPEATTDFFIDVRFHNNTSWYEENKDRYYNDVRPCFYSLIDDLAPYMLAIDHQMEVRPFKCLSRLRRDVRFTKDKSPYRDHLWLCFHRAGEPRDGANMFWFELSPENVTYGMGFWSENKPVNEKVRRFMAANPGYFRQLVEDARLYEHGLVAGGSVHKRLDVPEGFPEDLKLHYLRRDPLFIKTSDDLSIVRSRKIFDDILSCFQTLSGLYNFYRGYIDEEIAEEAEKAQDSHQAVTPAVQRKNLIDEW